VRLLSALFFGAVFAVTAQIRPGAAAEAAKICVVRSNGGVPAIIGKEKGFFAAQGLAPELVFFDSAQPIAVAVASGDCDFGSTGITAAFFNLASQGALKIIAGGTWDRKGFQSVGMIVSNRAYVGGLHSFKDLGGHSVAITQMGSPLEFFVYEIADKFHFDPATIKFSPLQSNGVIASAVAGNQVDAAVQTAAPSFALINKGEAKLLGWFSDELDMRQGEAVFTSTRLANDKPQIVRAFLAGLRASMAYWDAAFIDANGNRRDGPNAAEAIGYIAKDLGQPESVIREGTPYFDPQARISFKDMTKPLNWYKEHNMVKPSVDLRAMVDLRYAIETPDK
jgi:NitT/TauT family transport system substrate-binding protein